MELYLIRHSVAEAIGANNNYQDDQRALTEEGVKRAEKVGKGLRKMELVFDVVLSSPAARCAQTAEGILRGMKQPTDGFERIAELSLDGSVEALLSLLNIEYGKSTSVALVGHQPNLSDIASELLTDRGYVGMKMSRAGVLCLQTGPVVAPARASLLWKMLPGQLMKMTG